MNTTNINNLEDFINFNNVNNPYYSLFKFIIKIFFNINDLNNISPDAIEDFGNFLHEYTHYLQSITTIYGVNVFIQYFDMQTKIIKEIYLKVINRKKINNSIFSKYIPIFRKLSGVYNLHYPDRCFKNLPPTKDKILVRKKYNSYINNSFIEVYLMDKENNCWFHISPKVLRENMAMMAYFIIRNIGQDAIMDFIALSGKKQKSREYWFLFNFFLFNYPGIKDVRVFTYYFCELCLMTKEPGERIYKILTKINEKFYNNKYIYSTENSFFNELYKDYSNTINKDLHILLNTVTDLEQVYLKFSQNYEYFTHLIKFLSILRTGLIYKINNPTIYNNILDGRWITNKSNLFYSPIIIQSNQTFSVLNNKDNFIETITLLFGVSLMLEYKLKKIQLSFCPFFDEIPICGCIADRDENICLYNPELIQPFKTGGCLLYNSLLTLGLLPQNELKKYCK